MREPFVMPTSLQLQAANVQFGPLSEYAIALGFVLEWWDGLPPKLRQDIEGSSAEPGCIARVRRLVDHRVHQQDQRIET